MLKFIWLILKWMIWFVIDTTWNGITFFERCLWHVPQTYTLPLKDVTGWCSSNVEILYFWSWKSLTLCWLRQRRHTVLVWWSSYLTFWWNFSTLLKTFFLSLFFVFMIFLFQFRIFLIYLFFYIPFVVLDYHGVSFSQQNFFSYFWLRP